MALLSEINGEATATAPVEGAWVNDEGILIREQTVLVDSLIKAGAFIENLDRIRDFLHRFRRQTHQGEVAFDLNATAAPIRLRQESPARRQSIKATPLRSGTWMVRMARSAGAH